MLIENGIVTHKVKLHFLIIIPVVSTIFYNHYNYVQDYILTDIDCISYERFDNI